MKRYIRSILLIVLFLAGGFFAAATSASADSSMLSAPYGITGTTWGHEAVGLRFTALENVTLDSALFVYAGLADNLTLRVLNEGSTTILASQSIPMVEGWNYEVSDFYSGEFTGYTYLWEIGVPLVQGKVYELVSTGTYEYSSYMVLSNGMQGWRDPDLIYANGHIQLNSGFFETYYSSEHWNAFDDLKTTSSNGSQVPEPTTILLLGLGLAGLAGIRRK